MASSPTGVYRGVSADDRRAERRERLLDAGFEILGTEGWQATTVRGVCQRASLNPRYFYESFEDLDALLLAVFDRISAEALEAVLGALESSPEDALGRSRAVIEAFVSLMTEDPRKGRVAFIEAMGSEALMRRRLDVLQQFAELTAQQGREFLGEEAIDQRSAELTAQLLMGGLAEVLIAWLEGRLDVTRERLVDHCAAIFVATTGVSSA